MPRSVSDLYGFNKLSVSQTPFLCALSRGLGFDVTKVSLTSRIEHQKLSVLDT